MATIRAHGIEAPLPTGFEGRIFLRPAIGAEVTYPVAHFATFSLPAEVGDFGSGAVNLMGVSDIFAALFEYGPESLGKRLFERQGMPRALTTVDFRPYVLRRGLGGQSGTQWFFTETGRPLSLYVALGSHLRRSALVPRVNGLLANMAIGSPTGPAGAYAAPLAAGAGAPWN